MMANEKMEIWVYKVKDILGPEVYRYKCNTEISGANGSGYTISGIVDFIVLNLRSRSDVENFQAKIRFLPPPPRDYDILVRNDAPPVFYGALQEHEKLEFWRIFAKKWKRVIDVESRPQKS